MRKLVVVATTKVRIFKQITTISNVDALSARCCCYHKGTYFQANHNKKHYPNSQFKVVVATTKVRIFKQITTVYDAVSKSEPLLLLPQRYVFSSKSQQTERLRETISSCCCYHKGTYFQANHNTHFEIMTRTLLLLLPQRYVFSSKSQQIFCTCCSA